MNNKTDSPNDQVIVAGHWEIGYMTPIMEANYWNLPLRDFGVSKWYMTPVSGIQHNEQSRVKLIEKSTFPEIFEAEPDITRVFIEPQTRHQNPDTTWLHDFTHPKSCMYIFGSAHLNPTIGNLRKEDHVVTIKTLYDRGVLWANQCMITVLYDRLQKNMPASNKTK